jgi:radical SAM superfamily enzyme YgiQ (UPF0313 family)
MTILEGFEDIVRRALQKHSDIIMAGETETLVHEIVPTLLEKLDINEHQQDMPWMMIQVPREMLEKLCDDIPISVADDILAGDLMDTLDFYGLDIDDFRAFVNAEHKMEVKS